MPTVRLYGDFVYQQRHTDREQCAPAVIDGQECCPLDEQDESCPIGYRDRCQNMMPSGGCVPEVAVDISVRKHDPYNEHKRHDWYPPPNDVIAKQGDQLSRGVKVGQAQDFGEHTVLLSDQGQG